MLAFRFCVVVSAGAAIILGYGVPAPSQELPSGSASESLRDSDAGASISAFSAIDKTENKSKRSIPAETVSVGIETQEMVASPAETASVGIEAQEMVSSVPNSLVSETEKSAAVEGMGEMSSPVRPTFVEESIAIEGMGEMSPANPPVSVELPRALPDLASLEVAQSLAVEEVDTMSPADRAPVETTPSEEEIAPASASVPPQPLKVEPSLAENNVAVPTPEQTRANPPVETAVPNTQSILTAFQEVIINAPSVKGAAIASSQEDVTDLTAPGAILVESSPEDAPQLLEAFQEILARSPGVEQSAIAVNASEMQETAFDPSDFAPFEQILQNFGRAIAAHPPEEPSAPSQPPVLEEQLNSQNSSSLWFRDNFEPFQEILAQFSRPNSPQGEVATVETAIARVQLPEGLSRPTAREPLFETISVLAPESPILREQPLPLTQEDFTPFAGILNDSKQRTALPEEPEIEERATSLFDTPSILRAFKRVASQTDTEPIQRQFTPFQSILDRASEPLAARPEPQMLFVSAEESEVEEISKRDRFAAILGAISQESAEEPNLLPPLPPESPGVEIPVPTANPPTRQIPALASDLANPVAERFPNTASILTAFERVTQSAIAQDFNEEQQAQTATTPNDIAHAAPPPVPPPAPAPPVLTPESQDTEQLELLTNPKPATALEGVNPPEYLDPNANPLLFPTETDEVTIDISQPITLQQAIEFARYNNPNLREVRLQLESSREGLREALAAEYPTLSAQWNFSRQDSAQQELSGFNQLFLQQQQNQTITTTTDARLELNYDLYTGGRRSAQIDAAAEQVRFNQLEVERLSEQTRFEVARTYYDLQESDARVDIEQAAVADATQSLRDAQLLERAGLGTKFAVLQAEVELANSIQNLRNARARQQISRRELTVALGLGQQVEVTAADKIEKIGSWELPLAETILMAYQNRAELEQQLIQRNISEQQREIALSDLRPRVSLFANYNILGVLNDDRGIADGYTLGARLNWTLFEGGAARARAAQQEKNIEIAETRFDNQRNQIRLEVEQAYYNLQANEENVQTASVAVELAVESLRLARLRFGAGVGTQTEVIDAQTELTRARGNLLTAIITYNRDLAALQRAVSNLPEGRLFDLP
ncbi:TolC family protein [Lusitaniella coriacea]|uniref:TolC family protein n=1 Tax=Lusitaniella coriacea TaxID=1983105 RepID=UPI003CEBE4D2